MPLLHAPAAQLLRQLLPQASPYILHGNSQVILPLTSGLIYTIFDISMYIGLTCQCRLEHCHPLLPCYSDITDAQTDVCQLQLTVCETPMLQVCPLDECPKHIQLAMVVAHELPFLMLLLPFGLPFPAPSHQALIGFSLGCALLLKGRLGQAGMGSAYRSLPVKGRCQGMPGSLCCCLVPGPCLMSYLLTFKSRIKLCCKSDPTPFQILVTKKCNSGRFIKCW